jgi:Icc-related predicted phosphoesterase
MHSEISGAGRIGSGRLTPNSTIRIAAVADVHVGTDTKRLFLREFEHLPERADVLLVAGDLTQHGLAEEGKLIADAISDLSLGVPIVVVLGNHDYHQAAQGVIREHLERVGACVLEGEKTTLTIAGRRIGIAGVKGFGGGFPGACGSEFGEDEMKAFMRHSRRCAEQLGERLSEMDDCDIKIALTHYAPAPGTLEGERLEIYPFLGSYFLGEAIDRAGCTMAIHGHAHRGTERAKTAGGVPVRNVARPVIKLAYKVYSVGVQEAEPLSMRVPVSAV